jgi:Glu-tRNA(Gln) amidotransferase subunit E-like FAD-binding protein
MWKTATVSEIAFKFNLWPSRVCEFIDEIIEHEKHRQRQLKRAQANVKAREVSNLTGYFENDYSAETLTGEERYILKKGPKYKL